MQILILFILIAIATCVAEVTVLKWTQTVYDRSPKVRIRGSGFDAPEDIVLDVGAVGEVSYTFFHYFRSLLPMVTFDGFLSLAYINGI